MGPISVWLEFQCSRVHADSQRLAETEDHWLWLRLTESHWVSLRLMETDKRRRKKKNQVAADKMPKFGDIYKPLGPPRALKNILVYMHLNAAFGWLAGFIFSFFFLCWWQLSQRNEVLERIYPCPGIGVWFWNYKSWSRSIPVQQLEFNHFSRWNP